MLQRVVRAGEGGPPLLVSVMRSVVSGSERAMKGQTQQKEEKDEKVIAEAQTFADKWLPHENCVMDIALVDGKPKVIEFNNINGSGFYDHDVEKVFDKFYRVERNLAKDVKGSGLGLSFVKNVIDEHGGKIAVESELGKGTKFIISLPIKKT